MQQLQLDAHDRTKTAASLGIPVQLRFADAREISTSLARVDRGFQVVYSHGSGQRLEHRSGD
jgi:hypothetical protein